MKGIDISTHNAIGSYQLAAKHIDFVIIKATQGRSLDGKWRNFADAGFAAHFSGFSAVERSAYHYLTAKNTKEAEEEARYFCDFIAPFKNQIRWAAADVEEKKYLPTGDKTLLTAIVKTFCGIVESRGFTPLVYTNPDFLTYHMNNLTQYDLWLALWRDIEKIPTQYPNMKIWQYGLTTVPGIAKPCDGNLGFYRDVADETGKGEETVTYEEWQKFMEKYAADKEKEIAGQWAKEAQIWAKANGISDGTSPKANVKREEAWAMLQRFYKKFVKER